MATRIKKTPRISVTMPVYNADKTLVRAINSILTQTFLDFELIIVDDASTDRSIALIEQLMKKDSRIRLIRNEKNLQIASSLNKAVEASQAPIIARMDADDYSEPNRLALQYKLLHENPNVAIVGANMIVVDGRDRQISSRNYPVDSNALKKMIFRYSPFAHPVVMFRKSAFQEFGGYDKSKVPCEDIDLWFKIGSKYDFSTVPEYLLRYTSVIGSNSHKKLKRIELLGLKIKIHAILKYGFRPTPYDVIYNILEYLTLWFMPAKQRIFLYDFLRSRNLI